MREAGLAASKGITREGMNSSLEGEGANSIFELGPERYRKNSNNRSVCYVVENYLLQKRGEEYTAARSP